jgi:osmotically inducible lipoprotein OsmB
LPLYIPFTEVNMTNAKYLAIVVLALATAACGDTPGQRAVTGGALGAGTGAVIGAATGGSPLTGAVIGGAVGAVGGAATTPRY